jgi:hypothetical protein
VLFSHSKCCQDPETKQWIIELSASYEAKHLFFNIENIGYLRYQLKNILPLQSKYAYLLYLHLLQNRFRGSWEIGIEDLRQVVNCFSEYYKTFKYFKRDILDRALAEINEKTDIIFEYNPVKVGKIIKKIRFFIVKDDVSLEVWDEEQLKIPHFNESALTDKAETEYNQFIDFVGEAFEQEKLFFERTEIVVLLDLIKQIEPFVAGNNRSDYEAKIYRYALQTAHEYSLQASRKEKSGKPIKNPHAYIKGMLKKKLKEDSNDNS